MTKKEDSEEKKPVEVILVLPLGVEAVIFPWGVHSLLDYLSSTFESTGTDIKLLDLRSEAFFVDCHKRFGKTLSQLFLSLKIEQMNTIFATTSDPNIFLGLAACLGEDFFKFAWLKKWFRGSLGRDLVTLKKEVGDHIVGRIGENTQKKTETKRIWAFSVFDRTLFNSLYIARLVKEADPESSIIFGGDYFNFQAAEETFKNISFVDGIVVGYGEEVMRQILLERQKGMLINELRIKGFVNDGYFQEQGDGHSLAAVNVPPFYKELPTKPPLTYVRMNETGEIRILSQRGCSWGKCIFCAQIDKEMFFQISWEHLNQRIQTEVESAKSGARGSSIKISFDSDENSQEVIIRFIKHLNEMDVPGVAFEISLWYQVKSYRKELVEALSKIDNKKIHVHFMFNFESLNFDTLRNMHKGHSPLQAIEGAKAIQDCGHSYVTNYFMHYPLESGESIAHEVEMLKGAVHLLMPPNGGGIFFSYASNNRDTIYREQEKYKVKIRRLKGDTWLRDVFGIDLPFSMSSFIYDDKPSFMMDRLVPWSYYKTLKAGDAVYRPCRTAETNWEDAKIPIVEKIGIIFRSMKSYAWKTLHYSFTLIGKGKTFRHRTQLVMYLSKILEAGAPTTEGEAEEDTERIWKLNARMATGKTNVKQSHFFMEDGYLEKEYNGPGKKEKWSCKLNDSEFKILRFFYWTRKRKAVFEAFKGEMDEREIEDIIDRHIQLGSLVRFKGLLLCVINDKGYWK